MLFGEKPYREKSCKESPAPFFPAMEKSPTTFFPDWIYFIYLFGVLRHFQHCTGHIMMGSWKGRGNQYIVCQGSVL